MPPRSGATPQPRARRAPPVRATTWAKTVSDLHARHGREQRRVALGLARRPDLPLRVAAAAEPDRPRIMEPACASGGAVAHGLDAVLVHFRGDDWQRPSWIAGNRRPVALQAGGARLLQALPEAEGPDAAPAGQAIARNGEANVLLAPDRYRCRGLDDSDRPLWERAVDISL
jgi:hypothetical protein